MDRKMDINREIQLGEKRFINATNTDEFVNLELGSEKRELIEYDIRNVLNVTTVFNDERQNTDTYRVYDRIKYMSLLNGIKSNYTKLIDFFSPISSGRTITESFDFYLLKPSTGYTSLGDNKYVKQYEVISKLSEFDLYNSGYFVNIYSEQQYLFNFKKDYNVEGLLDGLHFPITQLALYAAYKVNNGETMQRRTYTSGSTETGFTKVSYTYSPLNIGDKIYGDLLTYDRENYLSTVLNEQTYYVTCNYNDSGVKQLVFKYDPILDFTVRVLDDTLNIVNISGTSYQDITAIPYYAIPMGDGNYIWRSILPKGYFDPITNVGVNFPFVNQRHYVFNNYFLSFIPDLTHANTLSVFSQIKYTQNREISKSPTSLDKIGDVC